MRTKKKSLGLVEKEAQDLQDRNFKSVIVVDVRWGEREGRECRRCLK